MGRKARQRTRMTPPPSGTRLLWRLAGDAAGETRHGVVALDWLGAQTRPFEPAVAQRTSVLREGVPLEVGRYPPHVLDNRVSRRQLVLELSEGPTVCAMKHILKIASR